MQASPAVAEVFKPGDGTLMGASEVSVSSLRPLNHLYLCYYSFQYAEQLRKCSAGLVDGVVANGVVARA